MRLYLFSAYFLLEMLAFVGVLRFLVPPQRKDACGLTHEMAKDEARHGKAFEGLLKRYFGK